MKYKCIIFDCDGVLVDSESISNQVIVDLANAQGANIDLAYAIKHYAGTSLRFVKDDIERIIEKSLPSNFDQEYRRISYLKFQTDIKAIEGIHEVLDSLEIPFCVASNGPLNKMKLNLNCTGLTDYFKENMFSAYEINAWKPNPKLFLHAAETMGFTPNECLVIEDSMSGVKAAIAGGFHVFAFTNGHSKEEFVEENIQIFDSMKELIQLLNS